MQEERKAATNYLAQLNEAVAELLALPTIHSLVGRLRNQLQQTPEPFVWSAIDLRFITTPLPNNIGSCWMFVLKKDIPSGCHYHPNSIQHMVVIEGEGNSQVGSTSRRMKRFGEPDCSLDDIWYVIPEGMPHEFFPKETDMVVI